MRKAILGALVAGLIGTTAAAQCGNVSAVSFTPYGQGCSVVTPAAPTLTGVYDPNACTVTLTLSAPPTCCNVFLQTQVLAIGLAPANLAIPGLNPGCNLLLDPAQIFLVQQGPPPGGGTFSVTIPPGSTLAGLTVYAQGMNVYFTTIGFTTDFELSQGLQVDFL